MRVTTAHLDAMNHGLKANAEIQNSRGCEVKRLMPILWGLVAAYAVVTFVITAGLVAPHAKSVERIGEKEWNALSRGLIPTAPNSSTIAR